MAKTKEDVAQNLKSYFMGNIKTIQDEYAWQIGKWEGYFNHLADAQKTASTTVDNILKEVRNAKYAPYALLVMALSMVGGAALGWLANKVKTDIYPNYATKISWQDAFVDDNYFARLVKTGKPHNEALADFFGTTIAPLVIEKGGGAGFSLVVAKIVPTGDKLRDGEKDKKIETLLKTTRFEYDSFKTAVKEKLQNEISSMQALLGTMYANANNNRTLGHDLLNALPASKDQKAKPDDLETAGIDAITSYVDTLRKQFAEKWFYFGNSPDLKSLHDLHERIELELWALWVLDQQFRFVNELDHGASAIARAPRTRQVLKSKDNLPLTHKVLGRLVNDLHQVALIDPEYHVQPTRGAPLRKILGTEELKSPQELAKVIAWAKKHPGKYAKGDTGYIARDIGTVRNPDTIFNK